MNKKIIVTLVAIVAITVGVVGMSAFEAHIINVTAHIENALKVDTTPIDFGTVFPQEKFIKNFWIELSDSFKEEGRVDDVKYEIHQKRKFRTFPKADVLFAFDTTGSMGPAIGTAKANAISVMNTLGSLIPDAAFGVVKFEDYPIGPYGAAGDSAYTLKKPITTNTADVQTEILALTLGSGGDLPQSYSRVMYESYNDPAIAWRAGAQRIVIILADDVPHDNDLATDPIFGLNPFAESNPWVTGYAPTFLDPGVDGVPGNADDLDFQTVLKGMATNNTILYYLSFGTHTPSWDWWAGKTGGGAVNAADFDTLPEAIKGLFLYEDLCPQLSKHKKAIDKELSTDQPPYDNEVPVPHPAGAVASGYMSKLAGDIRDGWDIDLKVPCFEGQCDQTYDPEDFGKPLDPNLEGQTFGCDLWIEVTGISETEGPTPTPTPGTVISSVNIGDTASEARYEMLGWSTTVWPGVGGGWGGGDDGTIRTVSAVAAADMYKAAYAAELPSTDSATITMDFGAASATKMLNIRHLDGSADDSFNVYVDGVLAGSYADSTAVETWMTNGYNVSAYNGLHTVRVQLAGPHWASYATFGQLGISWIQIVN